MLLVLHLFKMVYLSVAVFYGICNGLFQINFNGNCPDAIHQLVYGEDFLDTQTP